ncbi:MAG: recombinase XerC [Hyphomicrobiales bacterium]|nr:MAG: recombinase XerC [Hyphomicrobiales bacterium]
MPEYNARNERIKRDYFALLAEADQRSQQTIDGVRKAISRYEQFTEFADFAAFNKDMAVGFKRHLQAANAVRTGKPLSPATIRSTLYAVQEFFRWLAREPGYRTKIRPDDIRYLNLPRKDLAAAQSPRTRKVPTIEQVRAALAAMPTATEVERRDRALIAFTLLTGMRDGAIASLKLKHIDLDQCLVIQDPKEIKTKFSKRIETFFFRVGDDIERIVTDWIRHLREEQLYGHDDPVFPRTRVAPNDDMHFEATGLEPVCWSSAGPIRRIFQGAFAAAGLPYFSPHSFRSTLTILGEQICRTPEDFKAWSQNLGHESPLTTFNSYGKVAIHRQGQLVRNAGKQDPQDEKLDRIASMIENLHARKTS